MSQPQGPNPSIFHFGTTSCMIFSKGSYMSPPLLGLLSSFEEKLANSFKKLMASEMDNILSLSWMKLAMESLCETHTDIKYLIVGLELPLANWDDEWIDVYLKTSIELLDLCNALSSEISRLCQGHLMLQCALKNVDSSASNTIRVQQTLSRWKYHTYAKSPRVENCNAILESIIASLSLPRTKNSAKGKVLMRAMYGVKVKTLFISGIFTAALSGSPDKLAQLHVPEALAWSDIYTRLQSKVNKKIKTIFSNKGATIALKELAAVDARVSNLQHLCQVDMITFDSDSLVSTILELTKEAERFSHGLHLLSTEVDKFFRIVLAGRDMLLCSLRTNNTLSTSPKKNHRATVK